MIPITQTIEDARRAIQYLDGAVDALDRWRLVPKQAYNSAPSDVTTLIIVPSGNWVTGLPIRLVQGATSYYGIIASVTGNVLVYRGAELDTALPVNAIWIGKPELVVTRTLFLGGLYGQLTAGGELTTHANYGQKHFWQGPPAYLVDVALSHSTDAAEATEQPLIESVVYTTGWARVSAAAVPVTTRPPAHPTGALDPGTYRVVHDQQFGLWCTRVDDGSTAAKDLSATLTFVME